MRAAALVSMCIGCLLLVTRSAGAQSPATPPAAPGDLAFFPFVVKDPDCREAIKNGGFENGLDGWGHASVSVGTIGPKIGTRYARLAPANRRGAALITEPVPAFDPQRVESALLKYWLAVWAPDPERISDSFDSVIRAGKLPACSVHDCSDLVEGLEYLWNNEVQIGWRERSFDVTKFVTRQDWPQGWRLSFGAFNDEAFPTGWDIDGVSLVVCMKP